MSGMKVGRYEIIDEIGQGAMGTVYRAHDPLIEREVAIKTVSLTQLREEGADAESRFLREARSAGRLSHPNIVTIYDVGETESLAYIAMEFLSGSTLRELMDHHLLPPDLAIDTAWQMAEALAFAHEHGVIHRDVKPANVVITGRRGRVKLTDFGIAHLVNSNQTQAGQMLGSPRYMSPEQAKGREVDGRSDIFSLGAVLYEMLTGQYAFDGDSLPTIVYRVIHETPAQLTRPSTLPPALAELLGRMLHKQPGMRPDAREVADALSALRIESPKVPVAPTPPAQPSRGLRVLAFAAPLAVLLVVGIGMIVIEHFLPEPPAQRVVAQPEAAAPATPLPPVPPPPPSDETESRPHEADELPPPQTVKKTVPSKPPAPPAIVADAYLLKLDATRTELRIKRTELLLRYTEEHPDVLQVDRQLAQLAEERRRHVRLLGKQQTE